MVSSLMLLKWKKLMVSIYDNTPKVVQLKYHNQHTYICVCMSVCSVGVTALQL